MSDPEVYRSGLPTVQNWRDYAKHNNPAHACYIEATEHLVKAMQKCIQKGQDFERLKTELTSLIDDRNTFLKKANNMVLD